MLQISANRGHSRTRVGMNRMIRTNHLGMQQTTFSCVLVGLTVLAGPTDVIKANDGADSNAKELASWKSSRTAIRQSDTDTPDEMNQENALPFDLTVRGGAWFAAPAGDANFNGSDIVIENNLDLDDPEASFTGTMTFDFNQGKWEKWLLTLDAFDTSQDSTTNLDRGITVNGSSLVAGTRVDSSIAATSYGIHLGYDFFGDLTESKKSDPGGADMRLHVLGGARAFNLDQSFAQVGGGVEAEYDEWHAIIEGGIRLDVTLLSPENAWGEVGIAVDALGGFGISEGSLTSLDLFATLTWKPVPNAGIAAGYRAFYANLDDVEQSNGQDYEFDAYFAGFFVGAEFTF